MLDCCPNCDFYLNSKIIVYILNTVETACCHELLPVRLVYSMGSKLEQKSASGVCYLSISTVT